MQDITIAEGEVARTMGQVAKLVTNLQGGGMCAWVPEDERKTATKHITENGAYNPADDDVYGYSKVTVRVPQGVSGTAHGVTGGFDVDDGEEYFIENVDGNLVFTEVPASIAVTTPPTKTSYTEGDNIDYTGIVVTAYDGEGNVWTSEDYPDGIVPFNELVFPEKTAKTDSEYDVYTDGAGINAALIDTSYVEGAKTPGYNQYTFCYSNHPLSKDSAALIGTLGDSGEQILMTQALLSDGHYWFYSANLDPTKSRRTLVRVFPSDADPKRLITHGFMGNTGDFGAWKAHYAINDGMFNLPVSEVIPTSNSSNLYPAGEQVPVRWNRPGDDQVLEASFPIGVTPRESWGDDTGDGGSTSGGGGF